MNKDNSILPVVGTFFNTPACNNINELSAQIGFLGVPYEFGTRIRHPSSQKFAPQAIRDQRRFYYYTGQEEEPTYDEGRVAPGWFNPNTGVEELKGITMADCGDVNIVASEGERNFDRITETVRRILDREAFPVVVGGDHTITFPVVRAFDRYDTLDIVHFDAHIDFADVRDGAKIFAGSSIRRCVELPFVRKVTQIGLEWVRDKETYSEALKYGNNIITAEKFRQMGISKVLNSVPQAENMYVTIDIDVLASSVASGTTMPTPGGLSYLELRHFLTELPKRGRVVGFDLVEVNPSSDCHNLTARIATELILYFLAAIFPAKK